MKKNCVQIMEYNKQECTVTNVYNDFYNELRSLGLTAEDPIENQTRYINSFEKSKQVEHSKHETL
jgi:hypothetical protein